MFDVGIDIGGTKIAVGILDKSQKIVSRDNIPTGTTAKQIRTELKLLLEKLMASAGIAYSDINSIGVGSPGAIDRKRLIVTDASNLLFDTMDFSEIFPIPRAKVYLENDANAAAWGEAVAGAAVGSRYSVTVTLGTGIGGGIVWEGKLYTGYNGRAGELGHFVMRRLGRACSCGRRGCWEAYASVNALIADTRKAMRKHKESVMWDIANGDVALVDGKTAFIAAREKDGTALAVLEQYAALIACGLSSVIKLFQPEILCIGGGISAEGDQLLTPVRERVFDEIGATDTQILPAALANDAGIVGAALLYRQTDVG